ncbi:DUF4040 domain-containing protein [Thermodesulfobacteriota bacterium]
MVWQFDLLILALGVICALAAISLKDLLSAAIVFGAYSFLMCLLWTEMGAVDVAFTEAAVGAGVSTVFFLAAVYHTSRTVKPRHRGRTLHKLVGLAAAAAVGLLLLSATGDFPDWADPSSPASSHLSPHYITEAIPLTAVPNIVTSVLADFRSFDTMFETAVIFVAGLAVLAILGNYGRRRRDYEPSPTGQDVAHQSPIIKTACRIFVPFMQLFALYVVAHGHHSPGGGFQGGVILGASFILVAISYDLRVMQRRLRERLTMLFASLGVLIYAGIGALCLLLGANFLDYTVLHTILPATSPIMARSHGMLGVEIGVAFTVMAIMVIIYVNVASHGKSDRGL